MKHLRVTKFKIRFILKGTGRIGNKKQSRRDNRGQIFDSNSVREQFNFYFSGAFC